jgi:hypothetical protein
MHLEYAAEITTTSQSFHSNNLLILQSEEETIRRGLRTRRKQTTPNTRRRAVVAAKEAAAVERGRSTEARIFANDVAERVVEVGSTAHIYWHICHHQLRHVQCLDISDYTD